MMIEIEMAIFCLNHFIRLSRDENHTLYNTKIDLQSLEIQREDSCKKYFGDETFSNYLLDRKCLNYVKLTILFSLSYASTHLTNII